MREITLILLLFFHLNSSSQEIITLEYDNTCLDYRGPEVKTKGYGSDDLSFKNISIPTIQVFLPEEDSKMTTAIVVCPGGGMRANAFTHEGLDVAKALNKKGIAAFILKYRLVPDHLYGNKGLKEPFLNEKNQLSYGYLDGLNAIKHVRVNAERYNIDPNKIGIMGFSAGGAVTMEATYKSEEKNRPNFIASIYPWMVIVEDQEPPSYGPPLFMACTTEDSWKLSSRCAELYIEWVRKGFISELHNYHHGAHGFGMRKTGYPVDNWFNNMVNWIEAVGMLN
ncbi:MAG: alpha/beta hydrolase [Flavobacteriales bacterium TMED235]|nr:MAG: alpha/beta hydrolase [Flavobacteriales bacterium TMED235]|tara:strand:- start:10750 stop:11592 length:843 start_codon:yes stop_codon:yes gene_type:complete